MGPFKSRRDAERFIKLMELRGVNWADSVVVEEDGIDSIAELRQNGSSAGSPPFRKGP